MRGAVIAISATSSDFASLRATGANVAVVNLSSDEINPEPPYGVRPGALNRIDHCVSLARINGLSVVLGCLAAPGRRDVPDARIWKRPACHLAFATLWRDLAYRYRREPAVVGYNLLVEPDPEVVFDGREDHEDVSGTTADWGLLARRLTTAIRAVDRVRPVIVETARWAYARGFDGFRPTGDPRTVYAFHMFSPHRYTHQDGGRPVDYPGWAPGYVEPAGYWDFAQLDRAMEPAVRFQQRYHVPILVTAFGVRRSAPSAQHYVHDVVSVFERHGWSWAFWSYRDTSDWDPSVGSGSDAQSPLLSTYRSYLALNAHPGFTTDLPCVSDLSWVRTMRAVHARFSGRPGTVGLFGDSITAGTEFWTPLFSGTFTGDPATLTNLRRLRSVVDAETANWKGSAHCNRSGWHMADGLGCVNSVLEQDDPEVALVMFGTNDTNWGSPEERSFEANLRRFLDPVLRNGTVPILSTLPPKQGSMQRIEAYNAVIRFVAADLHLPLVDYEGAVLRRQPVRWYRSLIIGDGVHPSYPPSYQRDFTERGLSQSGFTLRNFLSMEAVLYVLDQVRNGGAALSGSANLPRTVRGRGQVSEPGG